VIKLPCYSVPTGLLAQHDATAVVIPPKNAGRFATVAVNAFMYRHFKGKGSV